MKATPGDDTDLQGFFGYLHSVVWRIQFEGGHYYRGASPPCPVQDTSPLCLGSTEPYHNN